MAQPPSRRLLLSAAALAPLAALPVALAAPDADADLIRLCAENIANLKVYNRTPDDRDGEDSPLWREYRRGQAAIEALQPKTIQGIVAKARLAKGEALEASPGGGKTWEGSPASAWAADVCNDLLRIYGEG